MSKSYKVFLLLLRIHSACQSLCSVIKVWNHHKNTIYVKLKKSIKAKNSDSFNYREKLWLHGSVCINIVQLLSLCMTQREVDTQGCRKVWKFGRALSNVVGIILPLGWDRVNWSAKYWGDVTPPAPLVPTSLYQHMTHLLLTVCSAEIAQSKNPDFPTFTK